MTQSTIDSEVGRIITAVWADGTYAGNAYKGHETIAPETAAQAITNLMSQEANKAKLETMQKVSDRLDDLHQDTEGAGWVHYGEMGEWLDDEISRLTADKEQAE